MPGTTTLVCPACGALLGTSDGAVSGSCSSCGSAFVIPDAVSRYLLPSRLGSTDVLRSVRRILESQDVRKGTAMASRVDRPSLFYVPYWHVMAQLNGFVFGIEPVYEDVEIPVMPENERQESWSTFAPQRRVQKRAGWRAARKEIRSLCSVNVSGADLEPLGIPSLSDKAQFSLTGMEIQRNGLPGGLEILDASTAPDGVLVDPSVPVGEAMAQADSVLDRIRGGAGYNLEQRWSWSSITGRRASLIYYPLWVVDFEVFGRRYKAVVDGRSGAILRGVFPGRRADRHIIAGAAGAAWAAVLPAFTDLFLRQPGGDPRGLSCMPLFLIVAGVLVMATFKLLRILDGIEEKGNDYVV
jgi:hypothetical protein